MDLRETKSPGFLREYILPVTVFGVVVFGGIAVNELRAAAPKAERSMSAVKPSAPSRPGRPGAAPAVATETEDDATAVEETKPKTIYEMSLEELREYQGFTYTSGGRDPMTFRFPVKKKKVTTIADPIQPPSTGGEDVKPQPTEEDKGFYLSEECMRLKILMYAQDYEQTVKVAEEVRRKFLDEWGLPTTAENRQLWSEVLKMHKTAKRLQQLEETRREFSSLTIDVSGIRWTPQGASVLIDGKIYEAGETVKLPGSDVRVMIEVIEEDAVVFLYKGQRFRKAVEIASN